MYLNHEARSPMNRPVTAGRHLILLEVGRPRLSELTKGPNSSSEG